MKNSRLFFHNYIHSLSDLCLRVEKKIFKEITWGRDFCNGEWPYVIYISLRISKNSKVILFLNSCKSVLTFLFSWKVGCWQNLVRIRYLLCQYVQKENFTVSPVVIWCQWTNTTIKFCKISRSFPIIHHQSEMSKVQFLCCFIFTLKIQQICYA